MWRFAILTAVFVNNLAATYYSTEKVWATPFEVIFGEAYPDTGIIMPFGCAALVLLRYDDRSKFKSRCILVIFVHYAENHPHSTYAFYSPACYQAHPVSPRLCISGGCISYADG
jgi:hypothetical protein